MSRYSQRIGATLRALTTAVTTDYPIQDPPDGIEQIKARLWNTSLSDAQRHDLRRQLSALLDN